MPRWAKEIGCEEVEKWCLFCRHKISSIVVQGRDTIGKPFKEDPVSEGSGVSGAGRLVQYFSACKTASLTGFTYNTTKDE